MKFEAIDIYTQKHVTGVGFCPSITESENKGIYVGYLIIDPRMTWEDHLEFTVDSDFYIVYTDSVKVIND